jgi:hypothetical protein
MITEVLHQLNLDDMCPCYICITRNLIIRILKLYYLIMKKNLRNFFQQGILLFVLFLTTSVSWGQTPGSIWTNPITGTNPSNSSPYTIGDITNENITVSGISRGPGVVANAANDRYNLNSWNTPAIDLTAYVEFTITPSSGYRLNLSSFVYTGAASGTGASSFAFRSSIDNFVANIGTPNSSGTTIALSNSIYQGITTPVTFRLYGWGASANTGTFSINSFTFNGTVADLSASVTTTQIATTVNTTTSAVSGGTITNTGGSTITAKGVVWSIATAPTVALTTKTNEGAGDTAFTSTLTGLSANTRYYYRAYVTFGTTTNYGTEYSFTTRPLTPGTPVVDNAGINKLDVAINANGNNSTVRYSIRVNGNGAVNQFVNATGTIGNANNPEVFQTAAQWGTKQITGLTANTTYSIDVRAENTANEFSAYGPVATGTTLPATAPALTIGTTSVTFGNVCTNAFAAGNFTFTGSNISGTAIINVAALPGYSYSLTQDGTYTATLNIPDFTGSSTTVYVRFTPSLMQRYNGNIELAGQGDNASAQLVVPVTGAGINTAGVVTTVAPVSSEITTSATLQGTATTGGCTAFSTYGFEYSTTPGFANGTGTNIAATNLTGINFSATVNGLLPSTTYYYKAYGTDGVGTHYGVQQSFTTESLEAPVTTAATEITQTSFTANWTAVEGAENYKLDVSTSASFGTGTLATDLFFSEYVEGNSNNKYIEIYNGTGAVVDLTDYTVRLFANGSLNGAEYALNGALENGATLVLKNGSANAYTGTAITSSSTNFSGDDAFALFKESTNAYVDIFGRIGEDPGTAWVDGEISTIDRTLVRKSNVFSGVTVNPETGFPTLAAEWDSYPIDNISFLGAHTYDFAPLYITGYEDETIDGVSETIVGLTPFTTYYYRVRANSATSTSDVSNVTSVTTKASTVTWTIPEGQEFAVWSPLTYPDTSPVILDSTVDAVINAPYNTGIHGIFSAKNITLNVGKKFTVATGNTLTVGGTITNNAAPEDFVVENNAALLQNNFDDNTSPITIIKNSNPLYRLDYTMWSSPVDGQTLRDFSRRTAAGRFYEYAYSDSDNEEHYRTVPSSTTFGAAKGYLIRMPDSNNTPGYNDGTATYTFPGTFKGAPHNGQVTIPASQQGNRYTAIGNPYPSPISVTDFFAANSGVINPSSGLYFWRKKNNAEASSYATLTLAAYTSNGGSGYTPNPGEENPDGQADFFSGPESTWLLAQGQGFIVRTAETPAGNEITFNNSMRRPAPESGQQSFFRTGASNTSRIWLNMTDSQNNYSQAAIAYMDNATLGLDYGYDGMQLTDGGTLTLYSTAEDTKLAVQARPAFTTTDTVPLGFKVINAGQFSFSIGRADGIFIQNQEVYLKDNLLNIVHNLGDEDYTFVTEAGTFNDRFEVVYTTSALGTDNTVANSNSVVIYKSGTDIEINSANAEITAVTVFNIQGRKLYSKEFVNTAKATIRGLEAAQEILIIEVTTSKGKVAKKILF